MSSIFRALAVDFDGTLTQDGQRPDDAALEATVADTELQLARHRIPVSEGRARILASVVRRYPR